MKYDDIYRANTDYFGEPVPVLREYYHLIDKSRPVLDIGAGQGRHTLFLARMGYSVDAVDPSAAGLETIAGIAIAENLPVNTYHTGFEDFVPENIPYSAALLFGIIQEIPRPHVLQLIGKIGTWIRPGGHVFITAFSTKDPSYERTASDFMRIDKNSFRGEDGLFRTYLEPDELPGLFTGYAVIQYREEMSPIHRHGDDPPHRHAAVTGVFQK